ncbi:MAG: hypothetical protein GY765_41055, partial [bacterium]|nr:hypothetical protein [bacterium]
MEGINHRWQTTKNRSLTYPYLPSGEYRFQVSAINNDGIESKPAQLSFKILLPFWKAWWFLAIVAVLVISILFVGFLLKNKRDKEKLAMKAKNRQLVMSQRMELVGMLAGSAVHDLKNLLSIIIGYSEIVAEAFKPEDSNYQYSEHIKSTAHTATKVVKQILAFARLKHDEGEAVELAALMTDILDTLKVT